MTSSEPSDLATRVARNLKVDAVTVEVIAAFEAAGVDSILLKGPTFARWLYAGDVRDYHDSDILIPPDRLDVAEAELHRLGFELPPIYEEGGRPPTDHAWVRLSDKVRVDLHWGLTGARCASSQLWDVLSRCKETLQLGGGEVQGLSEPARAMHVALHAAQHGSGFSKPADDLAKALEIVPLTTWLEAAEVARSIDAEEAFGAGLRLHPRGQAVAADLSLPGVRTTETWLRSSGASDLAVSLEWFLSKPGWRGKVAYILRNLFPSSSFMRDWSALARRGQLGLGLAYVWRPLSLLGRLPRALAELRRARGRKGKNGVSPQA